MTRTEHEREMIIYATSSYIHYFHGIFGELETDNYQQEILETVIFISLSIFTLVSLTLESQSDRSCQFVLEGSES